MVETSTNLASVKQGEDIIEIITSQRSSVESAKIDISDRMGSLFTLMGARVKHSDGYPGWKPDMESEVLNISREVYQKLFHKDAEVKAIHAGLECGIIGEKLPGMDMISIGPTIKYPHSPEEHVVISTVEKFYNYVLKLLENA